MKSVILVLSLILLAHASTDPMQCMLQLSNAYSKLAPQLANATSPYSVVSVLAQKENSLIVTDALKNCGIETPQVSFNMSKLEECGHRVMEFKKDAVDFVANIENNGFSNTTVSDAMGLVSEFKKDLKSCLAAANSLSFKNEPVFTLMDADHHSETCLDAVAEFVKVAEHAIFNMTSWGEMILFL